MSLLRYISHPEIVVDPDTPVPQWRLSERGLQRAEKMIEQPWVTSVDRIVSSDERKARETAALLGERLGIEVDVRPGTGEIDRSATGYVPHDLHDALADRCFAEPTRSAEGWERAIDAQDRLVRELADVLVEPPGEVGDCAVVGHGGVGTFLLCHLAGFAIDRVHDQPGGGHHWAWDRSSRRLVHAWRPIDLGR